MGLPCFPDIGSPASRNDIFFRMLESIALGELAIVHLINAEAEQIQAIIKAGIMGPVSPEDIQAINVGIAKILEVAAENERLLGRKLGRIIAAGSSQGGRVEDDFDDDFHSDGD